MISISPAVARRALLTGFLLSTVAGTALAQEVPNASQAAKPATAVAQGQRAEDQVGAIIVTARRREESAQAVPIALTVTTAQTLEQSGIANVVQLTQLVPTLQVLSPNARNTAITIRGLGASYGLANDGLEQGVGVYVDQVYNSRPASATFDFNDIRQIEVLRGPQGTLFGKNTTAGALNITTLDPSNTLEGVAEASYGSYNLRQFRGTASGPLIKNVLAVRLSVVGSWRDGNIYNAVQKVDQNAIDSKSVRGQLKFTPSDKLTVRLSGDYSVQQPECCTQLYFRVGTTLKPVAQQYAALAAGRNYKVPNTNIYDRLADVDSPIQADQWASGVSGIVDYDFGPVTLTSVSAHREWDWEPQNDRDYTALNVTTKSNNPSHQKQDSQEFRLASNGKQTVDWTAGLYYFNQNVTTHGITQYGRDASYWLLPTTNSPDSLLDGYTVLNNSSIDTTTYAAFGQLTWNISDRFRVTPGLRYTKEKKDGSYAQTTSGGSNTTDTTLLNRRLGIARPQFFTANTEDGSWSGQVAVSYDLTPDLHAYGTVSRGFKSGGINMTALPLTSANTPSLAAAVIKPEEAKAYELGLKSQFFNQFLTANLAAHATDVQNFQANVVDSGPGALRGYLANVEKVKVNGAELDLSTRSLRGFSGYLNLAWTDGKYESFKNGPCPLERIGTSTAACDLSGQDLPGVSPWVGSYGGEYRQDASIAGVSGEAYAGVDANFRTAYFADSADSIYSRIDAYTVVNLRAGFKAHGSWETFVAVKNALDEHYVQNITVVSGNSGLVVGTPGDDRTISLTVRARY